MPEVFQGLVILSESIARLSKKFPLIISALISIPSVMLQIYFKNGGNEYLEKKTDVVEMFNSCVEYQIVCGGRSHGKISALRLFPTSDDSDFP